MLDAIARVKGCPIEGSPSEDADYAVADAVLAALGIPADAMADDVKAGIIALRLIDDGVTLTMDNLDWQNDRHHNTPAAAVLALAAKLDEAAS